MPTTTRPHWTRPRIRNAARRYRRDLLLQAGLRLLLLATTVILLVYIFTR